MKTTIKPKAYFIYILLIYVDDFPIHIADVKDIHGWDWNKLHNIRMLHIIHRRLSYIMAVKRGKKEKEKEEKLLLKYKFKIEWICDL